MVNGDAWLNTSEAPSGEIPVFRSTLETDAFTIGGQWDFSLTPTVNGVPLGSGGGGTVAAGDVVGLDEAVQDYVGAMIVDSSTIDVTYNDVGGIETLVVNFGPFDTRYMRKTLGGGEKSVAATGTSGAVTADLQDGNVFTLAPTGNVTSLAFQNVPASGSTSIKLRVAQDATPRSIAMPAGAIHWFTDQPTQTANKVTVYTFETLNGGTDWDVYAGVEK